MDSLSTLIEAGLHKEGEPLNLHLGCGQTRLNGFINIDFPQTEHNVMQTVADAEADIVADLLFLENTVDTIYLSHVFEHFSRVEALSLLIRWRLWLKEGGRLIIEVPDAEECAKMIAETTLEYPHKMCIIRHMVGDQAAIWGFHIEQWFEERFRNTFTNLGFEITNVVKTKWDIFPHLPNIKIEAKKTSTSIPLEILIEKAKEILRLSMVSEREEKTFNVWVEQLLALLKDYEEHS